MELSIQEVELFFLFPDLRSKNFIYKIVLTFTEESKTGFENRKWNYPYRKWNYFSYFFTSNQKTSFTKCLKLLPTSLKPILKIENGLIQTGNGIIFTTYSPPFKKLLLPCSNQEGFLNHHVLFAEDCDHFDHMKQDCTTLSNNKSVTCKTLCHVLFFIFLFDFFNLYSPLYSCTISFNSSRSGGVLLIFAMQDQESSGFLDGQTLFAGPATTY